MCGAAVRALPPKILLPPHILPASWFVVEIVGTERGDQGRSCEEQCWRRTLWCASTPTMSSTRDLF